MDHVQIGQRWVGQGEPCFIIAEAGSNHNGGLDIALRLIDVAAEAGADAVKFQTFRAAALYPEAAGHIDQERVKTDIYQALAALEMPQEWIPYLAAHCQQKGILFLSSVFDEASADTLESYLPAFKIASYELTHYPLLRHVAAKGKPIILSTGASDLDEVAEAVEELRGAGCQQIVLLQCTAEYPAPLYALNLRSLVTLRETFGVPSGLSDHSRDAEVAPMAAVALGANVLEKHYTLSNHLPGPDHEFALEPDELAHMIRRIRDVEKALGDGIKRHHPVEAKRRAFGRRTLFALRDIAVGQTFCPDNVAVLRCGKFPMALHPKAYFRILGTRAIASVKAGTPIPPTAVAPKVQG